MTVESLTTLIPKSVPYRQTISPQYQYGSFLADDQANHDFKFNARGKSVITVAIDNPSDQTLTWSLYGMHESDGDVGDAGTIPVDETNTITTGNKGTATNTNAFPYYVLRCSFGTTPDGSTISVYINAHS